eukprot:SAG11_NODE_2711_length_3056_cov_1.984782_1_plen_68_part_00
MEDGDYKDAAKTYAVAKGLDATDPELPENYEEVLKRRVHRSCSEAKLMSVMQTISLAPSRHLMMHWS